MSAGLTIYNQYSQLTIDADTVGTRCIGKTTWVSTTQPIENSGTWSNGYSTHTFASSEPCIFLVEAPNSSAVGIIDIAWSGGLYTIGVYASNGIHSSGLDIQRAVDVWAVGMISGIPSSNHGLVMYSSSGALTHDFNLPNVTFPLGMGDISSIALVSGVQRPVVMGNSPFYDVTFFDNENGTYTKKDYRNFLMYTSGSVAYSRRLVFSGVLTGTPPADSTVTGISSFSVMEGIYLP